MNFESLLLEDLGAPVKNAIVGGPFGSNLVSKDYVASGVPVIRGQNMGQKWVGREFVFVSKEKAEQLSQNKARPGDLVFTQRGTLGQVSIVPAKPFAEYIVSQSQMKVTLNPEKADVGFMYYLFGSEVQLRHIRNSSIQTGVPHTNLGILRKTPVKIPPLKIQREIASILNTLDDRIALLRDTNITLEAIAQALFKSWFVDFDPVRAKQEGRDPEGIDADTAALFPDSFEESELGLVPKGWRVGMLGDELKIAYGKNLPTIKLLSSGYPVFGGNGQIGFFDKYLYESRQVLIACRGAASGKVNQSSPRAFVTNNSLILESNDATLLPFGYLKGYMVRSDLTPFVTGSAQPQVTIDNLKNFKILIPSTEVLKDYEVLFSPIENKIEENNRQAQSLATLRDTLLPRLISGQLRLPDAEILSKQVVND